MHAQPRTTQFSGLWTSPTFPESTQDGILHLAYTSNGELSDLSLKCSDKLACPVNSDGFSISPFKPVTLEHILGDDGGYKFTLFNAIGHHDNWTPLAFLQGAHLTRTEPRVQSLTATITNFEPWLRGLPDVYSYCTDEHLGFSAPKSTVIFEQQTEVGVVTFIYSMSMPESDEFGISFVPRLQIKLALSKAEPLPLALTRITDLCHLFSLLAGVRVCQTGPIALEIADKQKALFSYTRTGKARETTHYPLVSFIEKAYSLPSAVSNWFSITDKTREVLGKLSIFLVSDVADYEEEFLQACRIAESFARLLDDQNHVKIKRDGNRRNFEDCLKALFENVMKHEILSKAFARYEPQFSSEDNKKLSPDAVDQFLANVLWTRDELTHLVLDKPKRIGRALGTKELLPSTYTIAFAAACTAAHLIIGPLSEKQAAQLQESLATAYAVKQQVTLNHLFN